MTRTATGTLRTVVRVANGIASWHLRVTNRAYPLGVLFILLLICVALVVGLSFLGTAVSIFTSVLVGLVIGYVARIIAPGRVRLGIVLTALAGIAGSLGGAIVARALHQGQLGRILLQLLAATLLVMVLSSKQRLRTRMFKKWATR